MALVQDPSLLLANEPNAPRNLKSSAGVMNQTRLIRENDGIAVLVNLHNLGTARHNADRVVGLRLGEVVFDGSASLLTDSVIEDLYYEEVDQEIEESGSLDTVIEPGETGRLATTGWFPERGPIHEEHHHP